MRPNHFKIHVTGVLLAAIILLGSCEERDCIYKDKRRCDPDFELPGGAAIIQYTPDLADYDKNVLIEDFTGMRCTNCLPATNEGESLVEEYNGNVILMGVHCISQFARPTPGEEYFNLDMRTTAGEEYASNYNIFSLPNGAIDRFDFGSGTIVQNFSGWATSVQERLNNNPDPAFYIEFSDVQAAPDSSQLNVKLIIKPLIDMGETQYNYTLALLQDGIHEAQKTTDSIVTDYVHENVLRQCINGSYGQPLINDPSLLIDGDALEFSTTIPLTENGQVVNNLYGQPLLFGDWQVSDLKLVAFVNKNNVTDGSAEREVMQVEEMDLGS